ncbi:MAG: HAD family hydrolase [Clostridia bacterium]|nr:HAD family hydrolase [Clostridia bacterium]
MQNKAVFLDRDGTINIEKNYLYKIEEFEFIKNVPQAIKLLNENGFKVIVITNQSGIARGYYNEEDVKKLHKHIDDQLNQYDAFIDAYYYCPHHPKYGKEPYRMDCICRKPKTGLIKMALQEFSLEKECSWFVGDRESDIRAGRKAGLKTVLLNSICTTGESSFNADFCVEDLICAVKRCILRRE